MPTPNQLVFNTSGQIVAGACVWTYTAGTTTAVATYSDVNLTVANANPIIAGSDGKFTAYLTPGTTYKFVYEQACTPPAHGAVINTRDNIPAVPTTSNNTSVATAVAAVTLNAGVCAYLSDGGGARAAGQWYLCDSANAYSSTTVTVGMVPNQILSGGTGTIILDGYITGLSALTVGGQYYVGTAGAITTTAPANRRFLGQADTATTLVLSSDPPPVVVIPANPSNGQTLIGNATTGGYTLATLTAGTDMTVTNGAGSITLQPNSYVLNTSTTEQDVTNTSTETSIYSFVVPGNLLSNAGMLRLLLTGLMHTDTSSDTLTLRFKFGGTQFMSWQGSVTATTDGGYTLLVDINGNGATNSQRAVVSMVRVGFGTNSTVGIVTPGGAAESGYSNTMGIDTTQNQTLQVTAQWSSVLTTDHLKRFAAILRLEQ